MSLCTCGMSLGSPAPRATVDDDELRPPLLHLDASCTAAKEMAQVDQEGRKRAKLARARGALPTRGAACRSVEPTALLLLVGEAATGALAPSAKARLLAAPVAAAVSDITARAQGRLRAEKPIPPRGQRNENPTTSLSQS
mmetsp:Transcript_35691/g.57499  ORF Transcript_35691/g.57499 Transcript_35691/m.57499 type:complete len:140 (+) Transcript_35691:534-953(+)